MTPIECICVSTASIIDAEKLRICEMIALNQGERAASVATLSNNYI